MIFVFVWVQMFLCLHFLIIHKINPATIECPPSIDYPPSAEQPTDILVDQPASQEDPVVSAAPTPMGKTLDSSAAPAAPKANEFYDLLIFITLSEVFSVHVINSTMNSE